MHVPSHSRVRGLAAVMFGAGVAFTALEAQAEPVPVALTQVGNPSWRLTDFHLFTAPGGNDDLIDTTVEAVLPRHFPTYVPHTNHATEVSEGLAAVGITSRTTFSVDEISGSPLAVHLAFVRMPGPGAPTGVTRDFPAGGPIIPNSIYPLTEDGGLYLNGALIDPEFDAVRQPSPTGVGFSHTTIVITMHEGFFPAGINPVGSYVYRESQRDALGNGWDFAVPFTVVAALAIPEPSTWALFAVGLAGLAVAARRRPGR